MIDAEKRAWLLSEAKATVIKLLKGELTRQSDPISFEEDVPYMAVGYLEENALDWLLNELASSKYDLDGKLEIAFHLRFSQDKARQCIGFKGSLDDFQSYLDQTKGLFADDSSASDDPDAI